MKNTCLLALVALLAMSAAACKKQNQAEQLAALDDAYKSGVLSKAEYEAKRVALVGPAPPPAPVIPPSPPIAEPPAPSLAQAPASQPHAGDESESEPKPLAGCEAAEDSSGNAKGPLQRFYPAPIDSVKRAAGAALRSLDFDIHKDSGNEMEASKRKHVSAIVGAGGERLTLRFQKAERGKQAGTLVTGETRKSFVGRMAQKSWTNAVLAQIACHLRERR